MGVGQLQVCAMALAFVDVSELNVGDNTVIIGHREAVMALLTGSPAQRLEAALGTDILPGLASTLTPGTDDGVSAETFVGGGSGSLRRVAIVMLPTACSRHNSPSLVPAGGGSQPSAYSVSDIAKPSRTKVCNNSWQCKASNMAGL